MLEVNVQLWSGRDSADQSAIVLKQGEVRLPNLFDDDNDNN